jgi:predicted nucleotidyltransferase
MERDHVIAALKAHEQELRMAGVLSVSLFGSVARLQRLREGQRGQ